MKFFVFYIVLLFTAVGFAQVDDSTLLFDFQTGSSSGLRSGRYKVKPRQKNKPSFEDEDDSVILRPVQPKKLSAKKTKTKKKAKAVVKTEETKSEEPESVGMQVENLLLGGNGGKIEKFKNSLHPFDSRRNILEADLSTLLLYNDSSSNYWYRKYSTFSPGISFGAKFWLTPFFGIHTKYSSSSSASVNSSATVQQVSPATHQWFNVDLKFRKFYGISRKAPRYSFGLGFREYQFMVPANDTGRLRLRTTGLNISVETKIPTTARKSLWMGAYVFPQGQHVEISTGTSVRSGTKVQTSGMGLFLGRTYQYSTGDALFWRLRFEVEKNTYTGAASTADPVTSQTPDGVSITNGFSFFEVGLTFGR